jgi:hypothetical protein
MSTRDRVDTVERAFPVDGPHSPESVRDAALVSAHLARYLAHATGGRAALGSAPDTYAVLVPLSEGVASLAQTLRQVAARLHDWAMTDDTLRVDTLGRAAGPVDLAVTATIIADETADALTTVAALLRECMAMVGRLYHHTDDTDDTDDDHGAGAGLEVTA